MIMVSDVAGVAVVVVTMLLVAVVVVTSDYGSGVAGVTVV